MDGSIRFFLQLQDNAILLLVFVLVGVIETIIFWDNFYLNDYGVKYLELLISHINNFAETKITNNLCNMSNILRKIDFYYIKLTIKILLSFCL